MDMSRKDYTDLLEQTRKHLLQEYPKGYMKDTDLETYTYFATKRPIKQESAPAMKQSVPPPRHQPITKQPAPSPVVAEPIPPKVMPPAPKAVTPPPPAKTAPKINDLSDIQKILAEHCPAQRTIVEIAQPETHTVLVLTSSEPKEEQEVLNNLTKVIQQKLAPAEIRSAIELEKSNQWEQILNPIGPRLIIFSQTALDLCPQFASLYTKQSDSKTVWHLIPDIAVYLQQPNLKIILWKSLSQILGITPK